MWILFVLSLSLVGVSSRLLEHAPNFAPITALALVSGYYLRSRWSVAVPLIAMLASDAVLGFYHAPVVAAVYGSYAAAWLLGRRAGNIGRLSLHTLAASFLFFFVTNTAVWAFTGMYSRTLAGLGQSLAMGIPFFRATFFSDILYTAAFVLVFEAVLAWRERRVVQSVKA